MEYRDEIPASWHVGREGTAVDNRLAQRISLNLMTIGILFGRDNVAARRKPLSAGEVFRDRSHFVSLAEEGNASAAIGLFFVDSAYELEGGDAGASDQRVLGAFLPCSLFPPDHIMVFDGSRKLTEGQIAFERCTFYRRESKSKAVGAPRFRMGRHS